MSDVQDSSETANGSKIRRRSLFPLASSLQKLVKGKLWLQVLIGMILGLGVGAALGPTGGLVAPETAKLVGSWLGFPGQLFLTLIQMIVIPLVFASIIRGLCSTDDIDQLKKIGIRAVGYFIVTTAIAVSIGIFLALEIKPGNYIQSVDVQQSVASKPVAEASVAPPSLTNLPQKFLTLLPSNPLSSMVESNMLQIVIFASIVGIALVMMSRDQARPMLDILATLQEVCMTVVRWAMWLTPYAVFGLLAQLTSQIGLQAIIGMGIYVGTVIFGLFLLLLLNLLLLRVLGATGPMKFLFSARDVLLLAFSTSSSAAVMPLSIQTAEKKLGVRPNISQFIIPLGATINMNGTALYQGVAAIFLAQVYGVEIGAGGLILIVLTSVGASIGSPATPGVGIVILSSILMSVGVPPSGIALIMGVDRILDMCRTAINVSGDLVACVLINHWVVQDSDDIVQPITTEASTSN